MAKRVKQRNIKKRKINKSKIVMISIVVILIIFNIIRVKNYNSSEDSSIQKTENEENIKIVEEIKEMGERDRMEYYFSMFINYIENKNYEKAYDLLYDEFKKNYFPTLEDFQKYVEEKFPPMLNIEYENIERTGDMYVLWIYISDLLNGSPNDKTKMNVVLKENDLNDFVLSFSVI